MNIIDKKPLSMIEIERILSGQNTDYEIPSTLLPKNIHALYHYLKTGSDSLATFPRWEREVSTRIAEEFFEYNRDQTEAPEYLLKFFPSQGWIEHSEGTKKVSKNRLKYIMVQNYFFLTSHYWLLESARRSEKNLSASIDKLIELGIEKEIASELKWIFPGTKETQNYNSDNMFVLSQIPERNRNRHVKEIKKSTQKKTKTEKSNNPVITNREILDRLPTIEGKYLGTGHPNVELHYPFISATRLILYFWLEQKKPTLSTQSIEGMLFQSPGIIKARKWVFSLWFYEMAMLLTKRKQNKPMQESLLNIYSEINSPASQKNISNDNMKLSKQIIQNNWYNLKNDYDAAKSGVNRLLEKKEDDTLSPIHPLYRLKTSKLFPIIVSSFKK